MCVLRPCEVRVGLDRSARTRAPVRARPCRRPAGSAFSSTNVARRPSSSSHATWLLNHGFSCASRQPTGGSGTPARAGERARDRARGARPGGEDRRAARCVSSGLRNGEQTACQTADLHARARREADLGQIGVVDVAGQHADRRRRLAAAARARPRRSRSHMRAEGRPGTPASARGRAPGAASRRAAWRPGPTRRRQTTSFQASSQCIAGPMISGSDVPISRWSTSPVACSVIQSHSSGSTIERLPGVEHPAGARVDHHHARRADVAAVAPARALRPPRRPAWRTRAAARVGSAPSRSSS